MSPILVSQTANHFCTISFDAAVLCRLCPSHATPGWASFLAILRELAYCQKRRKNKPRQGFAQNLPGFTSHAKRWGEDRFAEAGDALASELGIDVAIVGSEKERSIAERVQGLMRSRVAVLNGNGMERQPALHGPFRIAAQ